MTDKHLALGLVAVAVLGLLGLGVFALQRRGSPPASATSGAPPGQILQVQRTDGGPVRVPSRSDANVEIRYVVRDISRAGIDAEATCLDCRKVMRQQWDTRPGPASQFLWFKCPGCGGVTWLLEGNLLREGATAREDSAHRSRIFKMEHLPFEPPRFD